MGLRQSYLRIAKRAAMMAGRYAHAKPLKRHRRGLNLRSRVGRIIVSDVPIPPFGLMMVL